MSIRLASRGLVPLMLLLAACGGEPTDPVVAPQADTLVAAAGAPAPEAIPDVAFDVRASDFASDDPALPGVPLSFNTVLVALRPDATVGAVNATLRVLGAEIAGGVRGVAGQAGGLLALRLPSRTHAEAAPLLAQLRAAPWVSAAAKDMLVGDTRLPPDLVARPFSWDWLWSTLPGGYNWGLEAIRAPQMWGLNPAVEKRNGRASLLVIDGGFDVQHPELAGVQVIGPTPQSLDHGTAVAAIAAGRHADGARIEGVTPYAELLVRGVGAPPTAGSLAETILESLQEALEARPSLQVVSISQGYNWYALTPPIAIATDVAARSLADQHGQLLLALLQAHEAGGGTLPVIVASAGNESQRSQNLIQPARYSSPMCNAALLTPVIVCVEGTDLGSAPGELVPYDASSAGGQVSAPAGDIWSAVRRTRNDGYDFMSGTSQAAPHVAGLVAYLYALRPTTPRPTLTSNPVRELLVNTGREVAGVARQVDAFAFVLGSDSAFGEGVVRTALLDIDDGSADGNQRQDQLGVATPSTDLDNDGGLGDGRVTMRDFRRFRDWLLQLENSPALTLDGESDNAKRDVNGNGKLEDAAEENLYPMGDFNGDGILSRTATAVVGGIAPGAPRTDFEVFRLGFNDPNAPATPLADLLNSGDIHVRTSDCVATGTQRTRAEVRSLDRAGVLEVHEFEASEREFVFTVPLAQGVAFERYEVRTEIGEPGASPLVRVTDTVQATLGGDAWWRPQCLSIVTTSLRQATVDADYSETLRAVGGIGSYEWRQSGGTLPPGLTLSGAGVISGTPSAAGSFSVSVTVSSGPSPFVATRTFQMVVVQPPPPPPAAVTITTTSLPQGIVGQPYAASLVAAGGTPPYAWSVLSTLPTGLSFSNTGLISGTPTVAQEPPVEFRVRDAQGVFASVTLPVPMLGIQTSVILVRVPGSFCPDVTVINQQIRLSALGGLGQYQWGIAGGTLPTGLSLDPTGWLRGNVPRGAFHNGPLVLSVTSFGGAHTREVGVQYLGVC